jgi:threonine dehydratase
VSTDTPTPLERATEALAPGIDLYLKREDVHELGAFKWRGALPVLERYRRDGAATVVTASTGNHGAATAWAAARLGLSAIVYAPREASREKVRRIAGLGAELRLTGADLDEAKGEGLAWAAARGLPFFEDGAEPGQLDGYGAIGTELLEQLGSQPAAVLVPVGNGALLAGVGRALGARSSGTLRVGVAAAAAPVMAESWQAGRVVESDRCATFADGLAVRVAIPFAVDALARYADRLLTVSERELADGVAAFDRAGIRVEGAAAAGLAALPRLGKPDGPVVIVVTGRMIDDHLHRRAVTEPASFS